MTNITIDDFLLKDKVISKNSDMMWCLVFMIQYAYIKNVDDFNESFNQASFLTGVLSIDEFISWYVENMDYLIKKLNKTFGGDTVSLSAGDFLAILVKYVREDKLLL